MFIRWILAILGISLVSTLLPSLCCTSVWAGSPSPKSSDFLFDAISRKAKEGKHGRIAGFHYYWDEGFHIDSRDKNLQDLNR